MEIEISEIADSIAANIHTEVVISGGEIEDIVRDYLDDNGVIEEHLQQADVLTESSDIWSLVEDSVRQTADERIGEQLSEYFRYGNGGDDLTRAIEEFLPDWLTDQLRDLVRISPESRCGLGEAFADAVNECVKTAEANTEYGAELAHAQAQVKFLEERVTAIEGGLTTVKAAFNHMALKNVPPVNPIVGSTPSVQKILDLAEGR